MPQVLPHHLILSTPAPTISYHLPPSPTSPAFSHLLPPSQVLPNHLVGTTPLIESLRPKSPTQLREEAERRIRKEFEAATEKQRREIEAEQAAAAEMGIQIEIAPRPPIIMPEIPRNFREQSPFSAPPRMHANALCPRATCRASGWPCLLPAAWRLPKARLLTRKSMGRIASAQWHQMRISSEGAAEPT